MTTAEIKALDTIWSYAVKERDGFKCRYSNCGETKRLNSHHIIKRQFRSLRWDINNGITLCVSHHTFGKDAAHVDEIGFLMWLKSEDINYDLLHKTRNESNKNSFAEQLEKLKYQSFQLNLHETLKLISKYESKDVNVKKGKKQSKKLTGIKALREKNGLTRESVARLLRVKDNIYDKIEAGRKTVSPTRIKQLAIIFKCRKEELL